MILLATPGLAAGEEAPGPKLEGFGYVGEEPSYFFLRDDPLANPRRHLLPVAQWQNRVLGNLNATLITDPLKVVGKIRPTLRTQEVSESVESKVRVPVDDLYLDVKLPAQTFATLGWKNYREGVSLSFNPTDFLAENKRQDFTKREEERKADREGNLVAALEVFLKNLSLTALAAPRLDPIQDENDRVLVKVATLFESIKLDASLSYFLADRSGVGLNVSKTLGEHLVLNLEAAGRWGAPRQQVHKTQDQIDTVRPARFDVGEPKDKNAIVADVVTGGNYTFANGANVAAEYYYVGDGYSGRQWDRVLELIEAGRFGMQHDFFPQLAVAELLDANRLLTFRTLRRHYVFTRFRHSALLANLDVSLSFLLNAEDRSAAITPIVDFVGIKNFRIGLNATILEGAKDSEFGLAPYRARVGLLVRYYF
jgi:hypothetical protein